MKTSEGSHGAIRGGLYKSKMYFGSGKPEDATISSCILRTVDIE